MDNLGYVPESENNGHAFTISRGSAGTKQANVNDFLVEINSRFKPSKKLLYYRRSTFLLAALAILLLLVLIIILTSRSKWNPPSICTSSECIRSAANFKYSINFSADPCDDFYQFCCGKWSQGHPNHGWYSGFSTFTTVTEKIAIEAMEVLGEGVKDGEPTAVAQAKKLYESCLATDALDHLGLNPLYDVLSLTNLPLVPSFFNQTPSSGQFDWIKSEILLKLVLAMDVFIGFTVQPNLYRRNENVMYMGVLYQSCPLPSPLKNNRWLSKQRKARSALEPMEDEESGDAREELRRKIRSDIFKHVTKYIMGNTSQEVAEENDLQKAADIINNITAYMDNLQENFTLPEGDYGEDETRRISFQKLQNLTDSNVRKPMPDFWINYISSLFETTNVTIDPHSDAFLITETELGYLWNVLDYVSSEPQMHIELYMWWSAVYAMIINTSSDLTSYIVKQTAIFYASSGSEDDPLYTRSRSLDCCDLVNKYMGWAVSYAVADKTFANKTKPKVEKMISDIKVAFIDHVRGIRWMDADTKKITLEKSEEMLSFIGYPDWLFQEGALDRKYWGLEINETTYLSNMVSIIMQYSIETLTSLRLPNPRDWSTEATVVNAYNSFQDNAINIPMAILNFPLYDLGLEVLNYGSIGAILGHEFTHGFDNAGRKMDKYGNYIQWWSNKTIETFEEMTKCFVNQYDNYTLKGIAGHVKGKMTLGENLADNGGLNQAYTAYQRYIQKNGDEPKLPGFEQYSSDQMFFIAYGSIWCETLSMEDLKVQLEHDEHCPNSVRVVGTLQNSLDFAKAFQCPKNSKMNPERKKCRIW
uniref:Endothelin-converting enzyme 1 n=2 Tax=Dendroctonus ponderosae TaxID=77166 RepID=A0AAR5PYJ0_DENPD